MTRIVHRVHHMIACHSNGVVFLLSEEDFLHLAMKLMADLETIDLVAFKLAVTTNSGFSGSTNKVPLWERTFRDRLVRLIDTNEFKPIYEADEEDAPRLLMDFLECYCHSYGLTSVTCAPIHDGSDSVVNLAYHKGPSLVERAIGRLGEVYKEFNFLLSTVERISGSPLCFELDLTGAKYEFGPNGVRQR